MFYQSFGTSAEPVVPLDKRRGGPVEPRASSVNKHTKFKLCEAIDVADLARAVVVQLITSA